MRELSRLGIACWTAAWLAAGMLAAAGVAAETPRLGWHGEEMPGGLVRGDTEGEYVWEKDGSIMVYIPPGPFPMGSAQGDPDEMPVHEVDLDGYYIDKYEVSWGQWKRSGLPYSTEIGRRLPQPEPPDWGIVDQQPMLNVSWEWASKYVGWAGKQLPTEAQWEKAARGTDGRTYPWGSEPPTPERAVWKGHPIALTSTAPVDCCAAGASPYGVFNMAGNVYEWCLDVYDPTYYRRSPRRNPVNQGPGRYRVLRGGAFVLEVEDLRAALRYRLLPEDRAPYIGFRGVLNPARPSSAAERLGWQAEEMPEGLERGEREGEYLWQKDGSVMVYVPPGPFVMGDPEGAFDEKPAHEVHLDGYYVDKYEVSWRQWRLSGLGLPKDIDGAPIKEHKPVWGRGDELPVSYIKWQDARSYAEWVGKRLPTEAEWEKAARGTDGRKYPWGNQPPSFERAVWKEHPVGKEQPAPVGCCAAGASPYGAVNMAGNVFEWCEDVYDSKFYARSPERNPVHRGTGPHRVLRGGAFVFEAEDLSATLRNRQYPEEGQDYVGFRLVISQPPARP